MTGYTVTCRSCGFRVLRARKDDADDVKDTHKRECSDVLNGADVDVDPV